MILNNNFLCPLGRFKGSKKFTEIIHFSTESANERQNKLIFINRNF